MKRNWLIFLLVLTACASGRSGATPVPPLRVQYTAASQPWLVEIYLCAADLEVSLVSEQRAADYFDPEADLTMRIGPPPTFTSTAYQIGSQEIAVVVNPRNPVTLLSSADLRALFSGQIGNWIELGGTDQAVQVWAYSPGEDIQQFFETIVMQATPLTSTAKLAVNPDAMASGIGSEPAAVGFLPIQWLTGDIRQIGVSSDVYTSLTAPVLVMPSSEPTGVVLDLIACLQK